jgi:hypothetical protein
MRRKIETFHKNLESGCRAEASKLRAGERIVNPIAEFCILSWWILWTTMMNHVAPAAARPIPWTKVGTRALDLLFPDRSGNQRHPVTHACYLTKIARLGGLSGAGQGFSARKCRHVARHVPAQRR